MATAKRRVVMLLLAVAPPILLIDLIARYAVDVPVGDEWALVPLFEKWRNHQLTFADLYHQHNEHRILISKLLFLAFAQLTHWNLRAEMFFSVALCVLTSAGTYTLLRRTLGGSQRELLLTWAAANLLLFSPVQAQNWMWGFQLHMFIPNLCFIATLVVLGADASWPKRFFGSVFLVALATFSFANALLLWPIVALVMLMRGESKLRIASWLLVFALVIALYLVGYHRVPAPHPVRGNWLDYPRYFLVFIGGPVARQPRGAMLAAAVALTVFVSWFVHFVRKRGEALGAAAPWLALGLFVIGSAALTARSRVDWRASQALESRYSTVSLYLYLALIVFAVVSAREKPDHLWSGRAQRNRQIALLVVTLVLIGIGWFAGIKEMARLQRERLIGLAAVEFSRAVDTTYFLRGYLRMAPGFAPSPVETIGIAERLGLLRYSIRDTAVLGALNDSSTPSIEFGRVDGLSLQEGGTVQMSGWAVLPRRGLPAPVVAVACRADNRWVAVSLAEVGVPRHDLVATHAERYRSSGWRATVAQQTLPPRTEALSAWAIDPVSTSAVKLQGDYDIR